jgi:hypothetical protein
MIVNRKMAELLAGNPGAAEIEVPSEFRMFLAGGFKNVEGCVFIRELFLGQDHAIALPRYGDATGYEASVNSQHVEDYLPRGTALTPTSLAMTAQACARLLATRLRAFSADPFRIIVSVDGTTSTIRFHKIREDERPWLSPNLEGYQEAILVLDTTDPEVDDASAATT